MEQLTLFSLGSYYIKNQNIVRESVFALQDHCLRAKIGDETLCETLEDPCSLCLAAAIIEDLVCRIEELEYDLERAYLG